MYPKDKTKHTPICFEIFHFRSILGQPIVVEAIFGTKLGVGVEVSRDYYTYVLIFRTFRTVSCRKNTTDFKK